MKNDHYTHTDEAWNVSTPRFYTEVPSPDAPEQIDVTPIIRGLALVAFGMACWALGAVMCAWYAGVY